MNKKTGFEINLINDPPKFLSDLLVERKSKNSNYSARAMARDLGMSVALLSLVMNKKRNLSLNQKLKLAGILGIDTEGIIEQLADRNGPKPSNKRLKLIQNTLEHEKIIRHWYHFAILEMTSTGRVPNEPRFIARRLDISDIEAKMAIHRLIEFGYMEVARQNVLKRAILPFMIQIKSDSPAVREYYSSRLRAADDELQNTRDQRVESRYFQNIFLPTNKAKVTNAKKLIAEFQENLIDYLVNDKSNGENDEVYQLGLQLFSAEKQKE